MKKILFFACIALFTACSKEKTDQELLDMDIKAMNESMHTEKVITYKFCKIMMRAGADTDTTASSHNQFRKQVVHNAKLIQQLQKTGHLSASQYGGMALDYQKMRSYVIKTDEDIFPTFLDMSNYNNSSGKIKPLRGKEKRTQEAKEHALLGVLTLLSRDLGMDVSLYECSQTDPKLLQDSEMKSLLLFYRGFVFLDKHFLYLSEKQFSDNIDWLEKHPKADMKYIHGFFETFKWKKDKANMAYLSINYLFRGVGRMMMDREIDEERSVEDMEKFVELSSKLGLSNGLTWTAEAYIHIKHGDNDKAIVALEKLKNSNHFSSAEKKRIQETIDYLKDKDDAEGVLESVFDKLFITKVTTGYVFDRVAASDWKNMVKTHVPHGERIIGTMNSISKVTSSVTEYTSGKAVKESGNDLKKEGEKLWDDAKGLVN
jgi:hypothetical protein